MSDKKTVLQRIAQLYYERSDRTRFIIKSLVVPGFGYMMGVIGNLTSDALVRQEQPRFLANIAFAACFIILFAVAAYFFEEYRRVLHEREQRKRRILSYAHSQTDSVTSDNLGHFGSINHDSGIISVWHDPMFSIKRLMRSLYITLESHYADRGFVDELIRFETTFMTKSYKDKEITIAAWQNKDGREPVSLRDRLTNPHLYKSTMTARVYEATSENERFWIIEDTNSDKHFSAVYTGQKDRIKSIIVYPVLSDQNMILGTIVVHCDKAGFFQDAERTYWRELLETFAKRIALEKKRLDHACENMISGYPF